jgi:hypothetical protein
MNVSGKMIPVKTVLGIRGKGRIKDNGVCGEVNLNIIHLMYCKNFCKYHNIFLASTTLKNN